MQPYTRTDVEADLYQAMAMDRWDVVDHLAATLDQLDTHTSVRVVGAALWYAHHGLPVFPLQPMAKVPYPRTRGCTEATTDPDTIRSWWDRYPQANIGLATGHGIDVIDFDGPRAHAAWSQEYGPAWENAGVDLRATVSTPRPGGLHVYIPSTGDGNAAGLVPGVDYRGRGGYVLAPPSQLDDRPGQHPGTYRFLQPLNPQDLPMMNAHKEAE